jgi:hypothetical protein
MADLYQVLGVKRTASQSEIKSAYRRLARQYHPDVNADPAAASLFARITEAYHVLIDSQRRDLYDRVGRVDPHSTARRSGATAAARAAQRAYYQARADRIVNEWLERERTESRARGRAVYTTVALFLSTFIVAMFKPTIFGTTNLYWRFVVVLLFIFGVWHLFASLKRHFDYYTYRPSMISVTSYNKPVKPFRRSVAVTFMCGGYLFSLGLGMLFGLLAESFSSDFFGHSTAIDGLFSVLFYPPIVVLIVDMMYQITLRLDEW